MYKKLLNFILMVFCLGIGFSQTRSITGTVTDSSNGSPLPGVNVLVSGTTNGTQTDFDGNYTIQASIGDILTFSYLGTKTKSVTVGASTTVDVALDEDASQLDEVVVTALGLQKQKKALTYATQGIETQELTQARTVNVLEGLSGKVAGISVTNSGAGVGAPSKVVLRGNRSIAGTSEPLYVVDGILIDGNISNLSPDNFEEIQVLRGANAAAIYGSRAQNGAIIIRTKTGKNREEGVYGSVNLTATVVDPIFLMPYQNSFGQGAGGVYDANSVTSWGPRFDGSRVPHWSNSSDFIANQLNGDPTYTYEAQPENVRDFFSLGHNLSTNLQVNVNKGATSTFLGYTYTDAGGIIPNNTLGRHNITARVVSTFKEKFTIDSKLDYIREDFSNVLSTGEGFDNPLRYAYLLPRNIRSSDLQFFEFTNESNRNRQHFYAPNFNGAGNPYWTANRVVNPRVDDRFIGLLSLKYDFTENFSVLGRSSLDRKNSNAEEKWYNDTYTVAPNGQYRVTASNSYHWNNEILFNYNKEISEDFKIDLNAGANHFKNKRSQLQVQGEDFIVENLFSLLNANNIRVNQGNVQDGTAPILDEEIQSVYGFGEISYKNAIFLNITGRNDWNSTLPQDNNSFFYPSVGLTTVFSDLIEMPDFISFLKLRGSYAQVGNATNPYSLDSQVEIENGTARLNEVLPNPDLLPEETESTELGLDIRFLNNRLRFDATVYKTNTTNQIFRVAAPPGTFGRDRIVNGGDIENRGLELVLGASIIQGSDFSWNLDVNFATNQSEVIALAGTDSFTLSQFTDFIREYRLEVGGEFGDVYTRGYQRNDQGEILVGDDGLPLITNGLTEKTANFTPDWLGGIRNSFRYKNFNLSALIDIRQGGDVISFTESVLAGNGLMDYTANGRDGLVFEGVRADGSPNTISTTSEALWSKLGGRNNSVGEAFVRDASNIRLRELVIGYTVPDSFLSKTFLSSASVSLVGRNLFFISNKAEIFDPEVVTSVGNTAEGRESFAPPTSRTIGLSINFGF